MKGGETTFQRRCNRSSPLLPHQRRTTTTRTKKSERKKKPPPSEKKKKKKTIIAKTTKTEKTTTTLTPQRFVYERESARRGIHGDMADDDDATNSSTKERARALCSRKDDEGEEKEHLEFTVPHVPVCGAPVKPFDATIGAPFER